MTTAGSVHADSLRHRPAAALRLVFAGLLVAAGPGMGLGQTAPPLFFGAAVSYLTLAVALAVWPERPASAPVRWVVAAVGDALFYALFLASSNGFASGLPTLVFLQVVVAAFEVALRFALFHAALAALALLAENLWRLWVGAGASDPFFVGATGAGLLLAAGLAQRVGERLRRAEGTRAAQEALLAWQRTVNDRIVQELADGVLWIDDQERIRYASPRVVAWLGHDPTGALLSEAISVAIAPGQERWWQSGRQLWRLKGGARDADGMWLLLLTDFAGVQRTFRQERLAALGLLLAGVAHEIRNPLAGVAQALDLLRDAESSTEREALIALADRNVARIAQMVNEVLLLGRQHPPRPQPLSLDSWLAAWLAELPAEEQKRIALLAASGERSSVAWVDPDHWRIIFENLVSNALAFASSRPEAVTIAVVETDGRIAVTVSDDGPGVAPEIEAHLFEPFVSQRSNGTGLGLYLAHELARANGGELRYQRATNGGAAFTVWLPQADAEGALRAA